MTKKRVAAIILVSPFILCMVIAIAFVSLIMYAMQGKWEFKSALRDCFGSEWLQWREHKSQIPTPKGFLEQRIKDNPIMPCYGLFNEEYTMDSECPRCPIIDQCKQSTESKIKEVR